MPDEPHRLGGIGDIHPNLFAGAMKDAKVATNGTTPQLAIPAAALTMFCSEMPKEM